MAYTLNCSRRRTHFDTGVQLDSLMLVTWDHVVIASIRARPTSPYLSARCDKMRLESTGIRGRRRKHQSHAAAWDPASSARATMPRAAGLPSAPAPVVKRPYYNLVFGREQDEDIADALVGAYR